MVNQIRNSENVELLSADFQKRYEPNFALGMAHSSHMGFGAIRGYWPFSSLGSSAGVYDVSGQGRTLTGVSISQFNLNALKTYVVLDGATDYYYRADEAGLRISGTESFIYVNNKGFSYSCWVSFTSAIGNREIIAAKYEWTAAARREWRIFRETDGSLNFSISTDGTAINTTTITSAAALLTQKASGDLPFQHVAVNFDPSTRMGAYINGVEVASLEVGVPANIFNSSAPYQIGANNGLVNTTEFAGMRTCQHVMSAMYMPEYAVKNLFQQTRAMFGT